MGIKFDWEIEAEEPQIYDAGEDPDSRRQRRRARWWLFLLIFGLLAVFGLIILGITLRLRAVDEQLEDVLLDVVDAEVAALRIGDQTSFLNAQRSATADWLEMQRLNFNNYQTIKAAQDVQLTGRVVDSTIEDTRGRVIVEEIIDGVPYARVWFYWRYEDGWRHVPPDYTFWGESATLDGEGYSIEYQAVDALVAKDVGAKLENWLTFGCSVLTCTDLPEITVEIIPDQAVAVGWSAEDEWRLQMPSPFTRQARLDHPFDLGLQLQTANLIAERIVGQATANQPEYPADAYYLRSAVVSWLVGRFAQVDTNSFLIASMAQNYGDETVGRLLTSLPPNGSTAVINTVLGTPSLDQANLDWRDFFTWRLVLENELIARQDEANFLRLYDDADLNVAYQRYAQGVSGVSRVVTSVMPENTTDGSTVLRAIVQVGGAENGQQEAVLFRLVDGLWRRLN